MKRLPLRLSLRFACLVAFLAACAAPPSRVDRMYSEFERDVAQAQRGGEDAQLLERQAARVLEVHSLVEKNALEGASDHFKAAVILVERTDSLAELALAYDLALRSAELGQERGLRVAAEALDRQMVKQRMHQIYGTQYVYDPAIKAWRLYPVDPSTSDAQRKAMGVPPMAELLKSQARLNQPPPKAGSSDRAPRESY